MKHFSAQTGGRYTYVDDIINLQDLALAFNSIFTDCDNFIVSGCEVSGTSISAGYVFINGELRYFPGASNRTWPQFIYESNSRESVSYASGTDKVGRNVYGCNIAASVPTALDTITGAVPQFIRITSDGGLRLKDALFGKYALLLNAASGAQTVGGTVTFSNAVNINGILTANNTSKVVSGSSVGQFFWDGNNFTVQTRVSNGTIYKLVVENNAGFKFYVGSTLALTVGASGIVSALHITSSVGLTGGHVKITSDAIYNAGQDSNASLNINMVGYNGGTTRFRNTVIGNGKNSAVLSVLGETATVKVDGTGLFSSSAMIGLILKSTYDKLSDSMTKSIAFRDVDDDTMATMGFITSASKLYSIINYLGNIAITGTNFVDLGPVIKEGGVLLSEKYVLASNYTTDQTDKANTTDVYTKTQANNRFAALTDGLSQFVVNNITKAILRGQIDALGENDVTTLCPTKANLLSDMATSEQAKATIRSNIGAAAVGQYQPLMADSGWLTVPNTADLHVRQIGKIVCIQGRVVTRHSGTVFTLPNGIDAPAYDVSFIADPYQGYAGHTWTARIAAGTKNLVVIHCSSDCAENIPFSLTYMTV